MLFKNDVKTKSDRFKQETKQKIKKLSKYSGMRFSVKKFFHAYISAMKSRAIFFNFSSFDSKTISNLLTVLEKNNRIAGYKVFPEEQNFRIFLSYIFNQKKPLIPKVIYYSSHNQIKSATLEKLQQFQKQNPNVFLLIETSRGIVDLRNCLLHKCGGKILVSLA